MRPRAMVVAWLVSACGASTESHAPSFTTVLSFQRPTPKAAETFRTMTSLHYEAGSVRMHYVTEDEVFDYVGTPEPTNAGMPRELFDHRLSARLQLKCERATELVHTRGATFEAECKGDRDRPGRWSESGTQTSVVVCKQELSPTAGWFHFERWVFAARPLEDLTTYCCSYDVCMPQGGLRFTD